MYVAGTSGLTGLRSRIVSGPNKQATGMSDPSSVGYLYASMQCTCNHSSCNTKILHDVGA